MSIETASVKILSSKLGPDALLDVRWTVDPSPDGGEVSYWAAAPVPRNSSFDGSGLPFASEAQAMEGGRATRGTAVRASDGTYAARVSVPNSYYLGLGTRLVPPALHVGYVSGGRRRVGAAKVAEGVPFRTLTYPSARTGPEFYADRSPLVHSQQQLLFASAFPS